MNERIQKLRTQTLKAKPTISLERALLLTEAYQLPEVAQASIPVQRGLVFKHILSRKAICLNDGELIVGERGPAPKATPTYPEVCCHSVEDLEILDSRPLTFFGSDQAARDAQRDVIIPFWRGRSMRDQIFQSMTDEWKDAYWASVFTEFMEQRAPGHTVLDDKIYKKACSAFRRKSMQRWPDCRTGTPGRSSSKACVWRLRPS